MQLPPIPHTADPATGKLTISGEQLLTGTAELYDVAGSIRGQLIDLIGAVKARDAVPPPKRHHHVVNQEPKP